ncbi:hypothetical protein BC829DRAFT_13174 [Chytridium lagenaria]|nr:hypothetical protein BC829DRAFT_13174 [Chytridium lagenaria]
MFKVYELRQCLNSNLVAVHREVENHESYFFLQFSKPFDTPRTPTSFQAKPRNLTSQPQKEKVIWDIPQFNICQNQGDGTKHIRWNHSCCSRWKFHPVFSIDWTASIVATSNTSENSVPGPAGATANQISSSNSVMNIPTLMRFRKANTIRPGAPTTTVFIEEIALIPNDADTPNLQPQLASGDATSLPPATRPAFIVSKKDWTPDKQSVYVYDGPSYVWMLITAVMEKSSGRDHSGTASTSAREHVNNSTTTVLAMERTTATEWAKELAHIRDTCGSRYSTKLSPRKKLSGSLSVFTQLKTLPRNPSTPPHPPPTPNRHR